MPTSATNVVIDATAPNAAVVGAPGAQAHILFIGSSASGALTIENGGTISNTLSEIGAGAGAIGTVTVDGTGSKWTNSLDLGVGVDGTGTLTVQNGGSVSNVFGSIGANAGSTGTVTVTGAGSSWTNAGDLTVGNSGTGTLTIETGATVSGVAGYIGAGAGSTGTVTVSGAGASWTSSTDLSVGGIGTGVLTIRNGGAVSSRSSVVGASAAAGSSGAVTIDGAGSSWTNAGNLSVGGYGAGTVTVQNGGTMSNAIGWIGAVAGAAGTVTIDGSGSSWTNSGNLVAGVGGSGTLVIRNGGAVSNTDAIIGYLAGSTGAVTVDGASSSWTSSGNLAVGGSGSGALTLSNGGTASATSVTIAALAGSTGTLNIGAGLGEAAAAAGSLNSSAVAFGAGTGQIVFNHTATGYVFTPTISGSGSVIAAAGVTILTGANTYSAGTTVSGGVLSVSSDGNLGAATGAVTLSGGVLQAAGSFSTARTITTSSATSGIDVAGATNLTLTGRLSSAGTGTLIKSGTGTLTFGPTLDLSGFSGGLTLAGGTLSLQQGLSAAFGTITTTGSVIDYASGITNAAAIDLNSNHTQLQVLAGSATQSGTISETGGPRPVEKIGAGVLVLSAVNTYSGLTTISAGTLALSGAGSIAASSGVSLATGAAFDISQTGGATIQTLGNIAAGQTGIVALGGRTLTVSGGGTFAGVITDGGLGGGTGGGLMVSGGVLTLTGANSYTGSTSVSSGTLALSGAGTIGASSALSLATGATFDISQTGGATIQALDNTAAGQTGLVALGGQTLTVAGGGTFAGVIQDGGIGGGVGGSLTVSGGTLTLAGTNTYTGGTAISGGTLSVSSDSNLGAATGGVTLMGGTLQTTASFSTARAIITSSAASVIDVTGTSHLTLTGLVSGSGGLTKAGAGVLTLVGNASYQGGTTINGGTLQLGNGGTSGALFGNVTNNGTLAFNRSDVLSLNGAISGNGAVRQIGSGVTVLTGSSGGFSGATTIETGSLVVDGALGGTLNVWSAGRLQGSGTVGATSVSGVIAPGGGTVIGTLNVAGHITFNAGSIYEVKINAAGQGDRLAITGAAAINGGTVQVLNAPNVYSLGTRYTILTATAGRSGAFDGLTQSSPLSTPFLAFGLSYDANNVYLETSRSALTFASTGQSRNQIATGGGLDGVPLSSPLVNTVAQLDRPQARRAFDQLSGEVHASARTALIEDSHFVRDMAIDRLRAAFASTAAPRTPMMSYAADGAESLSAATDRVALWGRAFGSWGHADGDANAARLTRSTSGFVGGGDTLAFDTWRLGLLAGYSRTDVNVRDHGSSGWADNYHLGVYGGTQRGSFAFRSGLAYTWHEMSTSRSVAFPGFSDSLTAKYGAGTAQAFGEIAYAIDAGAIGFEPFANLAHVNLKVDGFRETGHAAALSGNGGSTDATFSTLGLRSSATLDRGAALVMSGTLGWRHAFDEVTPHAMMALAGGTPFTIAGVPLARNTAVVETGLDLGIAPGATLGISYQGQFTSGVSDQSVRANFNWTF